MQSTCCVNEWRQDLVVSVDSVRVKNTDVESLVSVIAALFRFVPGPLMDCGTKQHLTSVFRGNGCFPLGHTMRFAGQRRV
jgi:hypothetical protein